MIFSKKKSFVIVIFVLSILIVGYFICRSISQKEERTRFFLFKDDFELANDYILGISVNHNDSSFNIIRDDAGNILSLVAFYDDQITEDVKLIPENTIIDALNNIDESFIIGSFDYIDVTEERIDYGGLGNYLYVYSRNGKRPKYFYSPNPKKDRTFFKTYYLIDDWYLLKGSSR